MPGGWPSGGPRGWIDAHCHLADPRLDQLSGGIDGVLSRSRSAGVSGWIQGGVSPSDWARQESLAARFPGEVFPTFGLHPWWVADPVRTESEISEALLALRTSLVGAIGLGELGLDFSSRFPKTTHESQIRAFEVQFQMALELGMPLILHVVRAHEPALGMLESAGRLIRGLVHSFSASPEIASRYEDLGLLLSVSGAVSQKGFESLKRSVVSIRPEFLVVETDAPDQPPRQWQAPLNEPAALVGIAQAIGGLRGESAQGVLDRSAENLRRVFWSDRK